MPQFDVHRQADGGLLLDCQADLLRHLTTRLVVPVMPLGQAPVQARRLNPTFRIDGRDLSMVTQYAASLPVAELGPVVASFPDRHDEIVRAFDMLLTGI